MIRRIGVTLDSVDVDLLDRFASVQGLNRSQQLREILEQARPMLKQTVEVLEAALQNRDAFLEALGPAAIAHLEELLPEVANVQNAVLGSMSRLEGALTAREPLSEQDEILIQAFGRAQGVEVPPASDPRPSNHGGHTPTPPSTSTTE